MPLNLSPRFPFIGFLGGLGFASGVAAAGFMAYAAGMSMLTHAIISFALLISFIIHGFATKIITGVESYVLYRGLLVSILSMSIVLWIMKEPLLPWFDLFAIGFGTFHVFGRLGCFFGGCCHGKLCNVGIKYGKRYADSGFPHYFVNRKIFPVQLFEAICLLAITLFCFFMYQTKTEPGTVFSWYIVTYAVARYLLEFIRGDTDRPYLFGFSEAQWSSAIFISAIVCLESFGVLPFSMLHIVTGGFLFVTGIAIYMLNQKFPERRVYAPAHVEELVKIVEKAIRDNSRNDQLPVLRWSSQDICMSLSALERNGAEGWHIAFSVKNKYRRKERIAHAFTALHKATFHDYSSRVIADRNEIMHYHVFYENKQ